ncbi:penicillin-binding protein [Streptobacillus ratti]|uniref:penicillin-binding protein n=1 Tax=Streptobacillus ratti TaxID=1720557 RepID=UPI000934B3A4|nr:penicillin-binding transpeptidase domain-containing protein [Streptobacillus ratti]
MSKLDRWFLKEKNRKKIYFIFFLLFLFLVIVRLFFLQILHKDFSFNVISPIRSYVKEIKAKRGSILTSDNLELAVDLEYQGIVVDPTLFKDKEEIEKFVDIINKVIKNIKVEETVAKIFELKEKNKKYYEFKNVLINVSQRDQIDELIKEVRKNNRENFNARFVYFTRKFKREYINNSVFETIVGFLNKEEKGVYGVEHKYDETLTGENGQATGTAPFSASLAEYTLPYLIDEKIVKNAKDGNNLVLTIDSLLQYSLDDILKDAHNKFEATTTMGIVMESDTGKIVAMSSYPKAVNRAEIKNHNITSLFEPGSIFKPLTVAMAMNEGIINENTLIHSDGYIKVKNRIIRDHDDSTKGTLPVSKIMVNSGNVGLVKISQMMNPETFYNYLPKFGLGKKTGVDISYETTGFLMTPKEFTEVRRSNVSFGQGINMTQLQMLVALNATINGGDLITPQIVEKIVGVNGEVIKNYEIHTKGKVIKESISNKIRKILEEVVSSGTGRGIKLDGYRIGGKTGTAQKAGPNGYEYGKYFSSFFSFFPADKPKYSILITVDEPHGQYYGASVALPLARDILDKIIKYKNVTPSEKVVKNISEIEVVKPKENRNKKIENIKNEFSMNIMPNLIGVTKKNLLELGIDKYSVSITGNGKVIKQYPEAGAKIKVGDKIRLELK